MNRYQCENTSRSSEKIDKESLRTYSLLMTPPKDMLNQSKSPHTPKSGTPFKTFVGDKLTCSENASLLPPDCSFLTTPGASKNPSTPSSLSKILLSESRGISPNLFKRSPPSSQPDNGTRSMDQGVFDRIMGEGEGFSMMSQVKKLINDESFHARSNVHSSADVDNGRSRVDNLSQRDENRTLERLPKLSLDMDASKSGLSLLNDSKDVKKNDASSHADTQDRQKEKKGQRKTFIQTVRDSSWKFKSDVWNKSLSIKENTAHAPPAIRTNSEMKQNGTTSVLGNLIEFSLGDRDNKLDAISPAGPMTRMISGGELSVGGLSDLGMTNFANSRSFSCFKVQRPSECGNLNPSNTSTESGCDVLLEKSSLSSPGVNSLFEVANALNSLSCSPSKLSKFPNAVPSPKKKPFENKTRSDAIATHESNKRKGGSESFFSKVVSAANENSLKRQRLK